MSKERTKAFYLSEKQDEVLENHRIQNNLTTSKQIRLMVSFIFRNQSTVKKFNDFIEQKSKEI